MSVGFLLSSPDDAVIWRGPKKNGKHVFLEDKFSVIIFLFAFSSFNQTIFK